MNTIGLGIGALLCFALALVMHSFYIDYEKGHRGRDQFLFSWPAAQEDAARARGKVLADWANSRASRTAAAKRTELLDQAYGECYEKNLTRALACVGDRQRATLEERERAVAIVQREAYAEAVADGSTRAGSIPVWSGMVPSSFITGGSRGRAVRAKAADTALWRGIIAPAALISLGVVLLVFTVFRRRHKVTPALAPAAPEAPAPYRAPAPEPLPTKAESALVRMLRQQFGADFPVASGDATKEDPLVITRKVDYVSIEYVVATHVMEAEGEEFQKERQSVSNDDGRAIDQLAYRVKPAGAPDWTGIRRFYFDITTGFNELGK